MLKEVGAQLENIVGKNVELCKSARILYILKHVAKKKLRHEYMLSKIGFDTAEKET